MLIGTTMMLWLCAMYFGIGAIIVAADLRDAHGRPYTWREHATYVGLNFVLWPVPVAYEVATAITNAAWRRIRGRDA